MTTFQAIAGDMWQHLAMALAAVFAVAYLPFAERPTGLLRSLIKTVPLSLMAWIVWQLEGASALSLGLAASALGDLALSRHGRRAFLAGLGAFALAHLCYLALFVGLVQGLDWRVAAGLVLLALSTELWLIPRTGDLRWPVRVYVILITLMALAASALPAAFEMAKWGAWLFLLSDLILAVQLFRMREGTRAARMAGWALWGFYACGQAMILLAFHPLS